MKRDAYSIPRHERGRMESRVSREVLKLWREHGGDFHGPNVETATIPLAFLGDFLAALPLPSPSPDLIPAWLVKKIRAEIEHLKDDETGGGYSLDYVRCRVAALEWTLSAQPEPGAGGDAGKGGGA